MSGPPARHRTPGRGRRDRRGVGNRWLAAAVGLGCVSAIVGIAHAAAPRPQPTAVELPTSDQPEPMPRRGPLTLPPVAVVGTLTAEPPPAAAAPRSSVFRSATVHATATTVRTTTRSTVPAAATPPAPATTAATPTTAADATTTSTTATTTAEATTAATTSASPTTATTTGTSSAATTTADTTTPAPTDVVADLTQVVTGDQETP